MTADNTYKDKAERYADDLLDRYNAATDTLEGIRDLIAVAWLEGSQAGSDETIALMRDELTRAVTR